MIDMMEHHRMLRDYNINVVYSGPLWAEGIAWVAGTLRKRMEFEELPLETSQEVFSVFVEQVNNMLMYSAEKEQFEAPGEQQTEAPKGTFILGTNGKSHFIQTGNLVRNDAVDLIKNKIDHLNTLDKQELRKYYKKQMRSDSVDNGSKGAGLGLIEIARRISSKIEYAFTPYDEDFTFFAMYVTIGGL